MSHSHTPKLRKKTVKSAKGPKHYACVRWQGKDHMLGRFGTREARNNYNRLLAEINAGQADHHDCVTTVSYTHLTLPTIYSV